MLPLKVVFTTQGHPPSYACTCSHAPAAVRRVEGSTGGTGPQGVYMQGVNRVVVQGPALLINQIRLKAGHNPCHNQHVHSPQRLQYLTHQISDMPRAMHMNTKHVALQICTCRARTTARGPPYRILRSLDSGGAGAGPTSGTSALRAGRHCRA